MMNRCAWMIAFFLFVTHFSEASAMRAATPRESAEFSQYFKKSGLIRKNHTLKKLVPGDGFRVSPHACRDGDDLYFLSTETGAIFDFPRGQSLSTAYPNGTAGAWWMIFKKDPKTGYFEFLGGETHRGVKGTQAIESALCPDVQVAVSGLECGKSGAESCTQKLRWDPIWRYQKENVAE